MFLNVFSRPESFVYKGFQRLYMDVYLAIHGRLSCNTWTFILQYMDVYLAYIDKYYNVNVKVEL